MTEYACLLEPAANHVYRNSAPQLVRAELGVLNEGVLAGRLLDLETRKIGGLPYLTLRSAEPLGELDVAHLANVSSLFALFEVEPSGLLRPVELRSLDLFDSDLLTILKYRGKTNEHFTKLMLNVTAYSSEFAELALERRLRVLDPLAGRGTTLNQALMYGWDSFGIELDGKSVDDYERFIGRYLREKKLKHRLRSCELRKDGDVLGRRIDVDIGCSKEAFKRGEKTSVALLHADARQARSFFRAGSFHVIVADLPYGVRHRSQRSERPSSGRRRVGSSGEESSRSRRPLDLLAEVLPVWADLLLPGGAIGLGWNRHVAGREKLVRAVEACGLTVMTAPPYGQFRHSVDQSILRDLVVARRPVSAAQEDRREPRPGAEQRLR